MAQHGNVIRKPTRTRHDGLVTLTFFVECISMLVCWLACLGLLLVVHDSSKMTFFFTSILVIVIAGIVPKIRGRLRSLVPPESKTGTGRQHVNVGVVDTLALTRVRPASAVAQD